jgi:pimeloyl-ACP methyl ester carboxylesterase
LSALDATPLQIDGIDIHIDGQGPETMVMIHGWPDTWQLWDAQVAHFKPHYRCVRFTLPGFDVTQPRQAHSLEALVDFFARVVDRVSPDAPVVLMLHDWGCLFGYQYVMRYPQRVKRLIGIDIGDAMSRQFMAACSLRAKLGIAAYQGWLALAWLVGGHLSRRVGDAMTRWMARQRGCRTPAALIGAQMNYPYYITWTGRHGSYRRAVVIKSSCPMFYAYALRKPFMFHSPAWAAKLAANPAHQVESYASGHWVMRQAADAFNADVSKWLQR